MFTDWFELNERHPPVRAQTYAEIPKYYVWYERLKMWKPQKQRKCIGRIVYSTLASGKRYFLRMLMNVMRGQRNFEELLTVNKRVCSTFKEACFAYGLLNDDREWTQAIQEASDTGKTFLYKTIIARLRLERKIILAVSSLGIASLLLPPGRTAHSRFVIPLELLENSTCGIKQNTHLAEFMQEVELITWDEAPMTQKYAFEALDKTLRDILGYKTPTNKNKMFGWLTVLLGGDFRQILPVIPKDKWSAIVQACINRSELWKDCKVFTLTRSMRVNEYYANGEHDTRKQDFNQWVLAIDDGKMPAKMKDEEDEPTWIQIPEKFFINASDSLITQIVTDTYHNFIESRRMMHI
nr:ATP-dependent DNA helicase PIF1-like [Tanacetum cinerariifolium]